MVLASNSTHPITQYEHAVANHKFVQVVCTALTLFLSPSISNDSPRENSSNANTQPDFRGHWCPFCMSYLTTLSRLLPQIASLGGKVLIVTAEPGEQNLAATRRAANNYAGEAIVDPEHKLANYLRERGLLDVAVTEKGGYVKGVAQPAILVVKKDGEVLEQWAIRPSTVCGVKSLPTYQCPLSFSFDPVVVVVTFLFCAREEETETDML